VSIAENKVCQKGSWVNISFFFRNAKELNNKCKSKKRRLTKHDGQRQVPPTNQNIGNMSL